MKKAIQSVVTHAVLTVILLSASSSFASLIALSDNLGNTNYGNINRLSGQSDAQGFRTTAQGFIVTGVTMLLEKGPDIAGNFSVSIYDATGTGGAPGSSAGSVVAYYDASLLNLNTASAVSWHGLSIGLSPDTNYYLVFTPSGLSRTSPGNAYIGWGVTRDATGTGFPSNRTTRTDGVNWDSFDQTYVLQMQINASNISAVPEPSTYALVCIGLAGLGYAGKRMKKDEARLVG